MANSTVSIGRVIAFSTERKIWYKRGVREAIQIRRTGSDLNRDRGRHDLPVVYNKLLLLDTNQSIPVVQSGQVTNQAE